MQLRLQPESAIEADRFPIALIVHDIRSLYNIGSIFRSADAFRVAMIALSGYSPTPPRKEISKTALGADGTVPWKYYTTAHDAIAALKEQGYHICALELTTSSVPMQTVHVSTVGKPLALLLGNELTGIDDDLLSMCDSAVEITMYGAKHSLNVAVATGIALYACTVGLHNPEHP